jgi:hypothetical protein
MITPIRSVKRFRNLITYQVPLQRFSDDRG